MAVWWTVKEIAEHYGLSERCIYDAIHDGQLVAHRFGRGRGGVRVADSNRIEWEQRCRELSYESSDKPTPPPREVLGLVKKHFDL